MICVNVSRWFRVRYYLYLCKKGMLWHHFHNFDLNKLVQSASNSWHPCFRFWDVFTKMEHTIYILIKSPIETVRLSGYIRPFYSKSHLYTIGVSHLYNHLIRIRVLVNLFVSFFICFIRQWNILAFFINEIQIRFLRSVDGNLTFDEFCSNADFA